MLKQILISFVLVLFAGVFALAQDKTEMKKHDMKMMDMKMDSSMLHEMKSDSTMSESIVRKGEIDLKAIDKNGDGKVFQDMMDWNVISDVAGYCPICEMQLKEVTLEKAKENLLKHNFKVKEDK